MVGTFNIVLVKIRLILVAKQTKQRMRQGLSKINRDPIDYVEISPVIIKPV
jgi:hypothetical protein